MILIDAINVQSFGGIWLLNYLIDKLEEEGIAYFLIYNRASRNKITISNNSEGLSGKGLLLRRKYILKKYIKKINAKTVLCFGNYGAPTKLPNVKVVASFQNLMLLENSDTTGYGIIEQLKYQLKGRYLKKTIAGTNIFVFPTDYISQSFQKSFGSNASRCQVIPFYDYKKIDYYRGKFQVEGLKKDKSFIYVSSPEKYKNHEILLDVWDELLSEGIKPVLKLTLPNSNSRSKYLLSRISVLNERGGQVINLNEPGYIPYARILEETYRSSFVIFPSLNETFGFGLLEGAIMNCKVLASDKPFVDEVVDASLRFDPHSKEDIKRSVLKAINNNIADTTVLMKDRVGDLIKLLITYDVE